MLGTEEIRFISFVYDKSCGLNHVPANMSGLRCDKRSQRWIKALRHLGCVCAATGNYLPCRSSSRVLPGHFLQFITIGCKVDLIEFQTHAIGSWCHGRSPFERRQHALSAWHRINLTSGKKKIILFWMISSSSVPHCLHLLDIQRYVNINTPYARFLSRWEKLEMQRSLSLDIVSWLSVHK